MRKPLFDSSEAKWLIDLGFPNCFVERYFISDLARNLPETRYVLVLESPHTDEVNSGYPLAGSAGKNIAEILCDDKSTAYGKKLSEDPKLGIGIMNVCQIPMQFSAYCYRDLQELSTSNLIDLAIIFHIRASIQTKTFEKPPKIKHCPDRHEYMLNKIKDSLKARLPPSEVKIISCGHVASSFLNFCERNPTISIRHPGRPLKQTDKNILKYLKDTLTDKA
jgi:hypothetical protein